MKEFRNYLIARGLDTSETPSGSDCVLIYDARGHEYIDLTITYPASASQLYSKRNELGIDLNKVHESNSGANWAAELNNNTADSKVNIFKVNSYRVDINGPIGLEFVETRYGDDDFQIFIPYNYTEDAIDPNYPAFIMNKKLRRVVISEASRVIQWHIEDCDRYFNKDKIEESLNPNIDINIHVVEIGSDDIDFTIIDTRETGTKNWGTFEHPSKDLMMLIRLLIRVGWIDSEIHAHRDMDVYSMKDLGIKESSDDVYGFEIICGEIRRFTKYSDDFWVEIPASYGGLQFIKTKEPFVYMMGLSTPSKRRNEKKVKITADVIIKMNSPEKGIYFICFNLEDRDIFTTVGYNIFDVLKEKMPQYEVEFVWPEHVDTAEVENVTDVVESNDEEDEEPIMEE